MHFKFRFSLMLFKFLPALLLETMLILHTAAQSKKPNNAKPNNAETTSNSKLNSVAKNINQTDTSLKRTAEATNNSVKTLSDIKNSIFKNKKANTITLSIADIDYDDENLSLLKENIKQVKGVKLVEVKYKSGTALIEVSFKGTPSDLWDNLPKNIKQSFKIVESNDTNMVLSYKKPGSNSFALPEGNRPSKISHRIS